MLNSIDDIVMELKGIDNCEKSMIDWYNEKIKKEHEMAKLFYKANLFFFDKETWNDMIMRKICLKSEGKIFNDCEYGRRKKKMRSDINLVLDG
jgi:hypothetical protein